VDGALVCSEKVAAAARWFKFIRQHLELTVAIIDGWVCLGVYHCYYANNSLITGTFNIIYRASAVSFSTYRNSSQDCRAMILNPE
jgi:hypothetical protein